MTAEPAQTWPTAMIGISRTVETVRPNRGGTKGPGLASVFLPEGSRGRERVGQERSRPRFFGLLDRSRSLGGGRKLAQQRNQRLRPVDYEIGSRPEFGHVR